MAKTYYKVKTGKKSFEMDFDKEQYLKHTKLVKDSLLTFKELGDSIASISDSISKTGYNMASILAKNEMITGTKTHATMITLDKKLGDSFQYRISKDKMDERILYKVSKMADGTKVVMNIENGVVINIEKIEPHKVDDNNIQKEYPIPEGMIGNHWLPTKHRNVLNACAKRYEKGLNSIVHLIGGSGYGKTSTAQSVAEKLGLPIYVLDCSTVTGNTEWYVVPSIQKGNTVFELTEFSKMIKQGNAVIVLDEANRVETWISNSLLPILDHRQKTNVYNQEILVGKGLMFFLTSNHGYEYSGTNTLDHALKGRIQGTLKVDAMPSQIEGYIIQKNYPDLDFDDIRMIVKIMNELRKIDDFPVNVSTRTSLFTADWISNGLSLTEAFEITVLNLTPEELLKQPQEIINGNIF